MPRPTPKTEDRIQAQINDLTTKIGLARIKMFFLQRDMDRHRISQDSSSDDEAPGVFTPQIKIDRNLIKLQVNSIQTMSEHRDYLIREKERIMIRRLQMQSDKEKKKDKRKRTKSRKVVSDKAKPKPRREQTDEIVRIPFVSWEEELEEDR